MNIYRQELGANLKSTLIWLISVSAVGMMLMYFFPMIKSDLSDFMKLIQQMPQAVQSAFGLQVESFSTAIGYYSFVLTYTALLLAIFVMNMGVGILSKEERDRTADFLMTKPVSRMKIMVSKLLASLTLILVMNIIYTALMYITINSLSEETFTSKFILIAFSLFFMQLIFFSIGFIISTILRKIKSVLPISVGLVFFFFAISAFAVRSTTDKLRFLTPFQYFKGDYIIKNNSLEGPYIFAGIVILLLCLAGSYIIFKRKNIHAI